jgi:hypothetical protein
VSLGGTRFQLLFQPQHRQLLGFGFNRQVSIKIEPAPGEIGRVDVAGMGAGIAALAAISRRGEAEVWFAA